MGENASMSDSEYRQSCAPGTDPSGSRRTHFQGPFLAKFNVILLGNLRSRLHLPCYIRAGFHVPKWDGPQKKSSLRAVRKSSLVQKISKGGPNL